MKNIDTSTFDWDGILVVIPARYKSSRFPGKPLALIAGEPMVVRTAKQCLKIVPSEHVYVATDDDRISSVCNEYGINVILTSKDHKTGSDRVSEVSQSIDAELYVNVQGDEPIFNPQDICRIVDAWRKDKETHVLTGYCPIEEYQWRDTKFLKLLFGLDNNLLYIGRAQVPGSHTGEFTFGYRQICVYAYTKNALQMFASFSGRSPIEAAEDHELMRFLEMGITTKVVEMSDYSLSVDRESDIQEVERRIIEESSNFDDHDRTT